MTPTLVLKSLRDIRLPLLVVSLLLCAFQTLWAKVTQRIGELILAFEKQNVSITFLKNLLFQDTGKIVQSLIGGENIALDRPFDMLTIGYVHPLVITILCIWAIGRSAGAIAGEIDRGTMELLLAQPVARFRVVLANFLVDCVTIPVLCLSLWAGNWLGIYCFQVIDFNADPTARTIHINPFVFVPALVNIGAFVFAVSGMTLWLSAMGRFRMRVLGVAILVALVQFLLNVIGQLVDTLAFLRPLTVFYYYQPQQIILQQKWSVDLWGLGDVPVLAVLIPAAVVGYGMALWTFSRRDLPAPL